MSPVISKMQNCATSFKDMVNSYRVRYAVAKGGQHIMMFVFTTYFLGNQENLNNIEDFLKEKLGSTQYKKHFCQSQQEKLKSGDHNTWDVSLLYKLLQKCCGLTGWESLDNDSLENLLYQLKELRNQMAHDINSNSILTKEEREKKLEEIHNLCKDILSKLQLDPKANQGDIEDQKRGIASMIQDLQEDVNESKKHISQGLLFDSMCHSHDAGGRAVADMEYESSDYDISSDNNEGVHYKFARGTAITKMDLMTDSLEPDNMESSVIDQLIANFWKYAGSEE